jgi:hypothetical protein
MASLCAFVLFEDPRIPAIEAFAAVTGYTTLLLIAFYLDRPSGVRRLRFKCPQFEIELVTMTGRPLSHRERIR